MISIIIPVRNGASTIGRSLTSIQRAESGDFEIIVVDDASEDESSAIAESAGALVIRNHTPSGAATSRNRGASQASGDILFFMDSDIEVPIDFLKRIEDFFLRPEHKAMIGILDETTEAPSFASKYENYYMHRQYEQHEASIGILYTSAAAIRKETFTAIGGFDEHYRGASIEDMEIGQRLVMAGIPIHVDKGFRVKHLKLFSLWQLLNTNYRKSAGTMKIKLRNSGRGIKAASMVAPPLRFLAGIPITAVGAAFLIGALLSGSMALAGISAIAFGLILILNLDWLQYLYSKGGGLFVVKSAGFLILNYLTYGCGIFVAISTFYAGRDY